MRNVNFHQEQGCIAGKCSLGMKVGSESPRFEVEVGVVLEVEVKLLLQL